jgi:hypothetical protein
MPGTYRGFCLRGKPDGRGEWTADDGHTYAGDWCGGIQHGYGKETLFHYTYQGKFRNGAWNGRGVAFDHVKRKWFEGKWEGGWHMSGVEITADGRTIQVDMLKDLNPHYR